MTAKRVTVTYWLCDIGAHRHASKHDAKRCSADRQRRHDARELAEIAEADLARRKWMAEMERHIVVGNCRAAGIRTAALARSQGVSTTAIRNAANRGFFHATGRITADAGCRLDADEAVAALARDDREYCLAALASIAG